MMTTRVIIVGFIDKLFDSTGFTPRRYCGPWTNGEILLHNISDAAIWLSYMAIPVVLIYFLRKKRGQVPFPKMIWMFGAFIILCGITHFMDIVMFYNPLYRLSGVVKALTAGVSLITAISLVPLVPKALAMRTSEELEREIAERKQAETELEQLHKQLLETSRQVGRAEVATSVLHNVGNVLNSVNIASSCVADSLRKSKAVNLSKVVTMLREHEQDLGAFFANDTKGKQLPGYLAQLTEHLAGEQTAALGELAQLQKNVEHIMDIVNMQQGFARVSGLRETLQLTDLVEDALKMNASSFVRHDIHVVKEFKTVPLVSVEKHNVLQILVNLVRNAKDACDHSGRVDKRLTLRVSNGQEHVRIAVADNGVGIPAENLTRIFSHGFTTRKDGHGFGLHSGALAAKAMGGSLTVHSDGLGQGATFTLELPCPEQEVSHE
jgi:two-component system NtrC family sensor kinase